MLAIKLLFSLMPQLDNFQREVIVLFKQKMQRGVYGGCWTEKICCGYVSWQKGLPKYRRKNKIVN